MAGRPDIGDEIRRYGEADGQSVVVVPLGPDAPAMGRDDPLADRQDYRTKYRFIGSWAVAADSGSGSKEMHTVYASPGAVESYLKTGHFDDGAVLVKEVFATATGNMTTGTVSHVDSLKGWFVMVRDSKNTAHPGNPLWGDG
jgi:Cytochrome P460